LKRIEEFTTPNWPVELTITGAPLTLVPEIPAAKNAVWAPPTLVAPPMRMVLTSPELPRLPI